MKKRKKETDSSAQDIAIALRSKIGSQFSDAAGNIISYKDLPKSVKSIIDKYVSIDHFHKKEFYICRFIFLTTLAATKHVL